MADLDAFRAAKSALGIAHGHVCIAAAKAGVGNLSGARLMVDPILVNVSRGIEALGYGIDIYRNPVPCSTCKGLADPQNIDDEGRCRACRLG